MNSRDCEATGVFLTHLVLLYSRVLLSGLGLNRGDGVAGFVRGGAVGCRGGDGSPGFAARQAHCGKDNN